MEMTDINNLQTLLKALSVVNGGGRGGYNAVKLTMAQNPVSSMTTKGSASPDCHMGTIRVSKSGWSVKASWRRQSSPWLRSLCYLGQDTLTQTGFDSETIISSNMDVSEEWAHSALVPGFQLCFSAHTQWHPPPSFGLQYNDTAVVGAKSRQDKQPRGMTGPPLSMPPS